MLGELWVLTAAAALVGFFHTLMGPDHYLPFVAMARAGKWTRRKIVAVISLCGLGHVASSVVIGFAAVLLGVAFAGLMVFERWRGNLAAWLMISLGLAYGIYGLREAFRNRPHKHWHVHEDGLMHSHPHRHAREHVHVHEQGSRKVTPWILFLLLVFGPCEPLIPLLMVTAAGRSQACVLWVIFVFAAVTLLTMLFLVLLLSWGLSFMPFSRLARFRHVLAGATLCLSGAAIRFLGL